MADTLRNTNTLNDVPSGERVHIGFFGIRNAGKSSVVNAVTNQELALVSEVRGTTTDPVLKAMELLPIGPVVIIDTPGIDDEGELGAMRVERTRQALRQTDVAVLVADSTVGLQEADRELLDLFAEKKTPCVVAFNKTDPSSSPATPSCSSSRSTRPRRRDGSSCPSSRCSANFWTSTATRSVCRLRT